MTAPNCIAGFFAGIFLANVVPHFVHGTSGDPFPTPFANPSGKGLSSPTVNVLWSLLNLFIACFLFRAAHINMNEPQSLLALFAGIAALSILLSKRFQHKHAPQRSIERPHHAPHAD